MILPPILVDVAEDLSVSDSDLGALVRDMIEVRQAGESLAFVARLIRREHARLEAVACAKRSKYADAKRRQRAAKIEAVTPPQDKPAEPSTYVAPPQEVKRAVSTFMQNGMNEEQAKWASAIFRAFPKRPRNGMAFFDELKRCFDDGATGKLIYDAIEVMKTSEAWTKDNGQYIPKPENWLADRGYKLVKGLDSKAVSNEKAKAVFEEAMKKVKGEK